MKALEYCNYSKHVRLCITRDHMMYP